MTYTLPLEQFSTRVKSHPDNNYLHQPIDRQLKIFTWGQVDRDARAIARSLQQMGLNAGDRVGILSKNCAEWFIADLAIMMAGMISVPIYYTANRETIRYIIQNSDCKACFVGKLDDLIEAQEGIDEIIPRIIFPYPSIQGQHHWQTLLETEPLDIIHNSTAQDTMTIVYTSGSTGKPKGVVISFENLAAAASETISCTAITPEDSLMSYLPLAHITERSVIETASFYAGCKIFFIESLDTFNEDLKAAQPNMFHSVPRLWTIFRAQVLSKISERKLNLLLKIPIINRLVAKKIRLALGLNNARVFGSGTAPISPAILEWYEKIGIPISEAWGMTETSGMSSTNTPFQADAIGSIGKPIACVEMKIGENKEILIRGPAVFKEYYLNPESTRDSFIDDWFRTGDMGEVTSQGNFKIIGRVKEQFKTAKGKYVAPVPIESLLAHNQHIEQICVIGQGRRQPIALVVMNEQNKIPNSSIKQSLLEILQNTNDQLESHQKLDHLVVLKENWTIENGLLTPTLKIKRNEIEAMFQHYLTADLSDIIIWEQ